jgi:3-(3-hydroxy-phenyl)propionate hydroxylase
MTTSMQSESFDVEIVGLGPTGLTLAQLLGRYGLRVIALEREPTFYVNARAVHTDDECLRIFQNAGVADELADDMLLNSPTQWVFTDGTVLAQFVCTEELNWWGATTFFYQPKLETTLESRLSRYPNVIVVRGREWRGLAI